MFMGFKRAKAKQTPSFFTHTNTQVSSFRSDCKLDTGQTLLNKSQRHCLLGGEQLFDLPCIEDTYCNFVEFGGRQAGKARLYPIRNWAEALLE